MKTVFQFLAFTAIACLAVACDKDEMPTNENASYVDNYMAVDMGLVDANGNALKIKWATCNVGAEDDKGEGTCFAWGETEGKQIYDWNKAGDYKWGIYDCYAEPLYGMQRYTGDVEGGDGHFSLVSFDDAATQNMGRKWRTPTYDEFKALYDQCEWTWDSTNQGYTVKSKKYESASIFLPVTKFGDYTGISKAPDQGIYWTSSLYEEQPRYAYLFYFYGNRTNFDYDCRNYGMAIRAVTDY